MKELFRYWRLFLLALLVFGNALVWYAAARESRHGILRVAFLDIGQGDAIYIESPTGNQVLIDGGPDSAVLSELGKVMPFYDRTIDLIIGSHSDADHIGGLPLVMERYAVGTVLRPEMVKDTAVDRRFEEDVHSKAGLALFARRGQRFFLGGGTTLDILYPDRLVVGDDTNMSSIVALVSYGKKRFILTGDAPQIVEQHLVEIDRSRLDAEVLKVGHHGSRTSSAPKFLSVVSPKYGVISAGEKNRYGHPHQEVLENLIAASTTILRTDEIGRIEMETDGDVLLIFRK